MKLNRELLIQLSCEIDKFDFYKILKEIYNIYKDVRFEGWLNGYRIVKVREENYKVIQKHNTIILRLTRDKSVNIPTRIKKENYISYNEYINGLKL